MFRKETDEQASFDPSYQERQLVRGSSGSRLRMVLLGLGLIGIGAIMAQNYLNSWVAWLFGGGAEAAPRVEEARAAPAEYREPPPKREPPLAAPPPETAKAPAQTAGVTQRPEVRISWDVRPAGEPNLAWFHDGRRPHIAHGCALRPGRGIIPAVLLSDVRSEVAGQALAEVNEEVRDADGVGRVLVPVGTRVVGYFKAGGGLSFQRRRLDFVWTELNFPDGRSLDLGNALGQDIAGSMAVGGEVETRWGDLLRVAVLTTVFDGIARGGASDDPSIAGDFQDAASATTGRLGREVTRDVLGWEPTIHVPAGTPIRIAPIKTVQVC